MNISNIQNKRILITGASSGIGKGVSRYLSLLGAKVVVTARDNARLLDTYNSLVGDGHQMLIADLSDALTIDSLLDQAVSQGGELDGIVHCAGIQKTLPLRSVSISAYEDVFNVNVKSALFLAKSFRRKGINNPEGSSIVFLSSVAALRGEPAISIYSASKGALISLTQSLAIELARQKIRVNCIAPGVVETEMADGLKARLSDEQYDLLLNKHPLGLGKVEDIANGAVFLLGYGARWVTGTTLVMDGGYSV
jgi:NAD(P)-dependent dehydrogenase (short-subunit alcohol dehydrogenase family)